MGFNQAFGPMTPAQEKAYKAYERKYPHCEVTDIRGPIVEPDGRERYDIYDDARGPNLAAPFRFYPDATPRRHS